MKANGNVSTGKPQHSWIRKRLLIAAELRGAGAPSPEALNAIVDGLSGFRQSVIDRACAELEITPPVDAYAPRMPTMAAILNACRRADTLGGTTQRSNFCRSCQHGRRRIGGEVIICDCTCRSCEGTGVVMVKPNGAQWDSRTDWKCDRVARACNCRSVMLEAA